MPLPTDTNPEFRRRLGYYFTGLSIGLVLLGLLYWARQSQNGGKGPTAPPPPASAPK